MTRNNQYYQRLSYEAQSIQKYNGKDLYNAFLDGVLEAMRRFSGEYVPREENAFRERSFAAQRLMVHDMEQENRARVAARIMANKYGYDKAEFRGMIFDSAHVNDVGEDCDQCGIHTDHPDRWPLCIYIHRETGEEIAERTWGNLSDKAKAAYRRVRYMDLPANDGTGKKYRLFDDDWAMMQALIRDDISIGDPVCSRYIKEACSEDGVCRRYRDVILKSAAEADHSNRYGINFAPISTLEADAESTSN